MMTRWLPSTMSGVTSKPDPVVHGVICGWCQQRMSEGTSGAAISHGICVSCEAKYFPEDVA